MQLQVPQKPIAFDTAPPWFLRPLRSWASLIKLSAANSTHCILLGEFYIHDPPSRTLFSFITLISPYSSASSPPFTRAASCFSNLYLVVGRRFSSLIQPRRRVVPERGAAFHPLKHPSSYSSAPAPVKHSLFSRPTLRTRHLSLHVPFFGIVRYNHCSTQAITVDQLANSFLTSGPRGALYTSGPCVEIRLLDPSLCLHTG